MGAPTGVLWHLLALVTHDFSLVANHAWKDSLSGVLTSLLLFTFQDSTELDSSPTLLPSTLQFKPVASSSTQTASIDAQLPSSLAKTKRTSTVVTADHGDAQDTVKLKFDVIEHLNLGDLLEQTNEVTVHPLFPSTLSDSDNSDSEDSGNGLMEELVRLSRKQHNAAAPEPVSRVEHHSTNTSESAKNEQHDVGVMSGPSVTSTGVSACLDPSTQRKSEETVFLDLRRSVRENPLQVAQQILNSFSYNLITSSENNATLVKLTDFHCM